MQSRTLLEWLSADLNASGHEVCTEAQEELCRGAALAVVRSFSSRKRLRPAERARKVKGLATHLANSAKAAAALDDAGWRSLHGILGLPGEPEDVNGEEQVLYLARLAALAELAATGHAEFNASVGDYKGGPTKDERIRALVGHLLYAYENTLGLRPKHTVDKDIHLATKGFTAFVKEAIRLHAPDGVNVEGKLIDNVVCETLPGRDLTYFTPPPLP